MSASVIVGLYFLVLSLVITGAVESGGVCAVVVIFVGVSGLYVLAGDCGCRFCFVVDHFRLCCSCVGVVNSCCCCHCQ